MENLPVLSSIDSRLTHSKGSEEIKHDSWLSSFLLWRNRGFTTLSRRGREATPTCTHCHCKMAMNGRRRNVFWMKTSAGA